MIGIRQLRADLAAHVRRAAGGETTVISIGGSPAAALTPLATKDEPEATPGLEVKKARSSWSLMLWGCRR